MAERDRSRRVPRRFPRVRCIAYAVIAVQAISTLPRTVAQPAAAVSCSAACLLWSGSFVDAMWDRRRSKPARKKEPVRG